MAEQDAWFAGYNFAKAEETTRKYGLQVAAWVPLPESDRGGQRGGEVWVVHQRYGGDAVVGVYDSLVQAQAAAFAAAPAVCSSEERLGITRVGLNIQPRITVTHDGPNTSHRMEYWPEEE